MESGGSGRYQANVSIITVCYNSANTIRDTLESVAHQTCPNIDHIIVDGLSTDDTLGIVKSFPHVHQVISEKDKGIYDAMNKGLSMATGDIIGILNSDDFYADPDVIRQVVEQMEAERADALYADLIYVSPQDTNKRIRTWIAGKFKRSKFLFGWMPPHPTFFVRKKIYDQFGKFDLQFRSAADYELMLRFLYKNRISVTYLPRITVKMRAGGNSNASWLNRLKANREDRKAWKVNNLKPYFFTLTLKPLRKLFQYF